MGLPDTEGNAKAMLRCGMCSSVPQATCLICCLSSLARQPACPGFAYMYVRVIVQLTVAQDCFCNHVCVCSLTSLLTDSSNLCRAVGGEDDGFVSYDKFRTFMMLLPLEALEAEGGQAPGLTWFDSATVVPLSPGEEVGGGGGISTGKEGLHCMVVLAVSGLQGSEGSAVHCKGMTATC